MADQRPDPFDVHLYDREGEVFPCVGEPLVIPGPAGKIEALTSCPSETSLPAIAIICHPHPLYGGTMQNKVVHYIAKSLNDLGLRALRFNFRGVGSSEGTYGGGAGETEDLRAVLAWTQQRLPGVEIWLAGFSFGACVALRAAARGRIARLITVAPAINLFDPGQFSVPDCPWLLVQGEADEVVPADDVLRWASQLTSPPEVVALPGVDHFFHGRLNVLRDELVARLTPAAEQLQATS